MSQHNETGKFHGGILILVILIFLNLGFFQNCAEDVEFDSQKALQADLGDTNSNLPGDESQDPDQDNAQGDDPPPQCVPGQELGVWLDPEGEGVIHSDQYLGAFVAYSGDLTSVENYGYYSASAHPTVGPNPIGYHLNVFFYEGPDGLSMNFFSNVDEGGSPDNRVDLDLTLSQNEGADKVLLSDDAGEIKITSVENDNGSTSKSYEGRFHYWHNTDGAVVGPLKGSDYKIQVKFHKSGDVVGARFYSADSQSFSLEDGDEISSFIIAFRRYETCN